MNNLEKSYFQLIQIHKFCIQQQNIQQTVIHNCYDIILSFQIKLNDTILWKLWLHKIFFLCKNWTTKHFFRLILSFFKTKNIKHFFFFCFVCLQKKFWCMNNNLQNIFKYLNQHFYFLVTVFNCIRLIHYVYFTLLNTISSKLCCCSLRQTFVSDTTHCIDKNVCQLALIILHAYR